jgi:hypothetical protein
LLKLVFRFCNICLPRFASMLLKVFLHLPWGFLLFSLGFSFIVLRFALFFPKLFLQFALFSLQLPMIFLQFPQTVIFYLFLRFCFQISLCFFISLWFSLIFP